MRVSASFVWIANGDKGDNSPTAVRECKLASTDSDGAFVEFDRVQKSYDGETLVVKDLNRH